MNTPAQLKKMIGYLQESAKSLDTFIKELTTFIYELEQKGKNNL